MIFGPTVGSRRGRGLLEDQHGPVSRVRGTASVRAFHQGGVERDEVHEHAEAEFFLEQPPADACFDRCALAGKRA